MTDDRPEREIHRHTRGILVPEETGAAILARDKNATGQSDQAIGVYSQ